MDKNYLKEHKLYEAHKQFMRLCEWSYVPTTLEEDDDDDTQQGNQEEQPINQGETYDEMQGDNMGDMQTQQGDLGDMSDSNMETQDNSMPTEENPMMGGEMDNMPPMDDMNAEDETVIDVDDITNAQEKMNDKVNVVGQDLGKVNDKIETLLQSLSSMEAMINNNNQEIAQFKAEFEKRNPTQTEKLNLRSLDSYPFNVNPRDYWAQKSADPNSNYSGFANNGEPTTQEYVITNNDVDDFSEREIEKSFDVDDDLKQDINKIFGF